MNIMQRMAVGISAVTVMTLSFNANATSCGSAATVAANIWGNWGEMLKTGGCSVAGLATMNPELVKPCMDGADKWDKVIQKSIKNWNEESKGSSATIGKRQLVLDDWEEGSIIGTTGRVFVTTTPVPSGSKVVINERGGKGKAGIAICKVSKDGKQNKLKEYTFNDSKSDKSNEKEKFTYSYKGPGDAVLVIHLDGKSVTNKFEYKVKVNSNQK